MARVVREHAAVQLKTEAEKRVEVKSEDYRREYGQTERKTEVASKRKDPSIKKQPSWKIIESHSKTRKRCGGETQRTRKKSRAGFFRFTKKIIGVKRSVAGGRPRQLVDRVTMAAQIKFIQLPLFAGKEEEDVNEWMERYEKIGHYNRRGDAEKRAHVELSLTGAAQKWFNYKGKEGQLATDWGTAAGGGWTEGSNFVTIHSG